MSSNEESISLPPVARTQPALQDERSAWATIRRLLPYFWHYKWRVIASLVLVLAAKLASVGVPILLKELIDAVTPRPGMAQALFIVPMALLLAYGLLRLSTVLFTELRELVFAPAAEGSTRRISLEVFSHLHSLSLRFHLDRQTGGMTRDIDRGTRSVQALISMLLYNILPTLVELALVLAILGTKFGTFFIWVTVVALVFYIGFTVAMTEWRIEHRKAMNELGAIAQTRAVDSLLNYETVKYFNNEEFEARRYDASLDNFRKAALRTRRTLSLLTFGQQIVITTSLMLMLWHATAGVIEGSMTLGELVMVNAFMIQLFIPLNALGIVYREMKQSLIDLDKMFLLLEKEHEVRDAPTAQPLAGTDSTIRFEDVSFAYEAARPILQHLSFEIPAGKTVAVVGPSGSGKSTLARLLYRFYDVQHGRITIGGEDIREVTQSSVRRAIGIVPQDTVLFNDTVEYNIAYGRPGASREEVEGAARAARIHDFISATPKGYETTVGERGLKLSGGEKQRVAIARTLLKDPPILIFDEATSALDSANERAIQSELRSAAQGKTTLMIAHRLSTVVDAHEILVLEAGVLVERGTHAELLAKQGRYARMWAHQKIDADA
ncbi:ABCB family ABC transporter ATP-binding protein/permease [Variovorax sp. LT1R20]|uniref:ABCB family ABC transporter ATP-binding protein/permease n=1 Tax=Variovorax sp. LT1R20 TaxID=3443729 RepID=UPI003F45CD1F